MRVLVKRADAAIREDERVEFCRLNMLNDVPLYLRVFALCGLTLFKRAKQSPPLGRRTPARRHFLRM